MKKVLLTLLGITCAIIELVEFFFFPIVFLIAGLLLQLPWQYYAIFIGGYFAFFLLGELILYLGFKKLHKQYSSRFVKKLEKIISKFSTDAD